MAQMEMEEFEFPDEKEAKAKPAESEEFEFEIEDDTPPEDRGREPMPKEMVEELENDELEDYSENVKTRLKQMKKVWHDERREKEQALREQQEALDYAQRLIAGKPGAERPADSG
jgi:mono/diheme cytochrome c family protein